MNQFFSLSFPSQLNFLRIGIGFVIRESQEKTARMSWDKQGKSKYEWPLFNMENCLFFCQGKAGDSSSIPNQAERHGAVLEVQSDPELLSFPLLVFPAWQQRFKQVFKSHK